MKEALKSLRAIHRIYLEKFQVDYWHPLRWSKSWQKLHNRRLHEEVWVLWRTGFNCKQIGHALGVTSKCVPYFVAMADRYYKERLYLDELL